MHKTLQKVKNKRLADLVENIITKMDHDEVIKCVQTEASLLAPQFKNPDIVTRLNNDMLEFLSMPVLAGKDKGEVSGAVIKVDGAYKCLKQMIIKKMKLIKPLDAKSLDAFFYLHVYDLALIAFENRKMRKLLKIKKGFFG